MVAYQLTTFGMQWLWGYHLSPGATLMPLAGLASGSLAIKGSTSGKQAQNGVPPAGPCRACCAHLSGSQFNIPGSRPSAVLCFSTSAPLQASGRCVKRCRRRLASPAEPPSSSGTRRAAIGGLPATPSIITRLGAARQALRPATVQLLGPASSCQPYRPLCCAAVCVTRLLGSGAVHRAAAVGGAAPPAAAAAAATNGQLPTFTPHPRRLLCWGYIQNHFFIASQVRSGGNS